MQNNGSHANFMSLSVAVLQSVLEFVRGGDTQPCHTVPFTKELEHSVRLCPGEIVKGVLKITLFSKTNKNSGRRQWVENNHMLRKSGTVYLVTTRGQDISFPLHLKSNISKSLEPEYYFRYDCSVWKFHLYIFLNSICTCFLCSRGYGSLFSALACSSTVLRFVCLCVLALASLFEGIQQYYIFYWKPPSTFPLPWHNETPFIKNKPRWWHRGLRCDPTLLFPPTEAVQHHQPPCSSFPMHLSSVNTGLYMR